MLTRDIINPRGKRVTVMGLGLFGGGLGITKYLVDRGAIVTVTDLKREDDLKESVDHLRDLPIRFKFGGHDEEDFANTDLVIVSPAVPKNSKYLRVALESGVPLETEMNLFFKLCPSPIIGITGSNGKTTTTSLVGDMIQRENPKALVGGNIGKSLMDKIEVIDREVPVVLELSSFQLENLGYIGLSPHIAGVINISPNHLDRHRGMEDYIRAKKNIILGQKSGDLAVLNYDDRVIRNWNVDCRGKVIFFGMERTLEEGVYLKDGKVVAKIDGSFQEICRIEDINLLGKHNLQNSLAATAVALACKVGDEHIRSTLRTFKGVEHRLEFVREVRGVKYYNDSKATTPEAATTALNCFDEKVVLIAGGYDKKVSFNGLAQVIAKKVKSLVLIGDTAEKIAMSVSEVIPKGDLLPIHRCESLSQAVDTASRSSQSGDVILLSPACASYDMFRNFEDRGRRFKELVNRL